MTAPEVHYDVETDLLMSGLGVPVAVMGRVVKTTTTYDGDSTTSTPEIIDTFHHGIDRSDA